MSDASDRPGDASRPRCRLSGTDGNAIAVIGRVRRALIAAGERDRARDFVQRAWAVGSYDAVLALCFEYVEVS